MKYLLYILVCVCSFRGYGQNLKKDVRKDWYATVNSDSLFTTDTITYTPEREQFSGADLLHWWHNKRNIFKATVIEYAKRGIRDPIGFADAKWHVRKKHDGYYLRMTGGWRRLYKVIPIYDKAQLKKLLLIDMRRRR